MRRTFVQKDAQMQWTCHAVWSDTVVILRIPKEVIKAGTRPKIEFCVSEILFVSWYLYYGTVTWNKQKLGQLANWSCKALIKVQSGWHTKLEYRFSCTCEILGLSGRVRSQSQLNPLQKFLQIGRNHFQFRGVWCTFLFWIYILNRNSFEQTV